MEQTEAAAAAVSSTTEAPFVTDQTGSGIGNYTAKLKAVLETVAPVVAEAKTLFDSMDSVVEEGAPMPDALETRAMSATAAPRLDEGLAVSDTVSGAAV